MNAPYKRVALGFVVAIGMLGVVPGVAFAAAPSCGDTIMVNTTLHADMHCEASGTDGITFGRKGITLDLNGHTIWGPTSSDNHNGINTNAKKHVTVKNGTISDFQYGLYADESIGGTFKNLTIQCDSDDLTPDGVYVYYGANNTINKLHIDGCYEDIEMYGSTQNWVTNNNLTAARYGMYTEYDSQDHFVNNYAEATYAFYEDYSGSQTWTNNEANGLHGAGIEGFYFDCDTYGAIWATGNEAYGFADKGLYLYYCYDWTDPAATPSLISNNSAHDNGAYGIYDEESVYATVTTNVAKNNEAYGFYLYDSGHEKVTWNIANQNGSDGFYTDSYSTAYNFASFANNKANSNGGYGIDGVYAISNASGNTAHNNSTAPDDCYNVECNQ